MVAYGQTPLEEAANMCSDDVPYCREKFDCDVVGSWRYISSPKSHILHFLKGDFLWERDHSVRIDLDPGILDIILRRSAL